VSVRLEARLQGRLQPERSEVLGVGAPYEIGKRHVEGPAELGQPVHADLALPDLPRAHSGRGDAQSGSQLSLGPTGTSTLRGDVASHDGTER
jgi:hypothetical protein